MLARVRTPMLIVALLQGAALYGLHLALEARVWPATDPRLLFPLYAVGTLVPLVLHLDLAHLRDPLFMRGVAAFAALLALLGVAAGATIVPTLHDHDAPVTFVFGASMVALWWIVTPFLQTAVRSGRPRGTPPYTELFEAGWQNTLVVVQAGLFTALFWALLFLWASLFRVVGVRVFENLFEEPAFAYPVTSVTFGYAVALAQSREQFVLLLRRHLFGVLLWLLPLVAFIACAFLLTLPATGLAPLWKTGHATFLMLWLQVFLLFFFNAAYQDGSQQPPYPTWLRTALRVPSVAVPVYASLCVYSLSLRIAQHGLSVDRIWALLFTVVIALYGAGYAYAALREGPWMAQMGKVNTVMAWVLVALLIGLTTPLLEPKRLAAADQVSRLLNGKVTAAKFDYDYLRFNTGVFGDRALRRLAAGVGGHSERAEIARRASASLAKTSRWESPPPPDLAAVIEVLPKGASVPEDLLTYLRHQADSSTGAGLICMRISGLACVLMLVDLDGDSVPEAVSLNGQPMNVYARTAAGWRRVGEVRSDVHVYGAWLDSVRTMPARTIPSRWHTLDVAGRRFYVVESKQ